jgi:hypothetical protein
MGSGHRELPPAKEVVVVRKFITTEEQSVLLQWAAGGTALEQIQPAQTDILPDTKKATRCPTSFGRSAAGRFRLFR